MTLYWAKGLISNWHKASLCVGGPLYFHSCSEGREEQRLQVDLLWEENSPASCYTPPAHTLWVGIYSDRRLCCESLLLGYVLGVPVAGTGGGQGEMAPERPETVDSPITTPMTSSSFSSIYIQDL